MGRSGAASYGRFVLSLLPFLLLLAACGETEPLVGSDQITFPLTFSPGEVSNVSTAVVLVRNGGEWLEVPNDVTDLDDDFIHASLRYSDGFVDYELLSDSTWTTTIGFDPIMSYDWEDGRFTFVRGEGEFHGEGDFERFTLSQYSIILVDAEGGDASVMLQNFDSDEDARTQIMDGILAETDTIGYQTWERLFVAE